MILKDKLIVITGASQGFGKALAKALKRENAQVVISSNDEGNLEATAQDLSVDYFLADVTSFDNVRKLGEYAVEKYGKIDFWINNAGIQIAPSLVEDVDIKKLHILFEVNFFGYFYGCQIALTQMRKQNSGVIMNISSSAGLDGKPELSAYTSSKFAVKGLTESIRREIKDADIQILGVFPGGMQTDIYKEKYPDDFQEYMEVETVVEQVITNLTSDNPAIDFVIRRPRK
jgi:NAD(P)-dependent dehydrogenase (short-subunit alcohol dehydrogenase family)